MTYTDPNYSNRRYSSYVDQYRDRPFAHPTQLQSGITVKVEDADSADVLPAPHAQYAQQQQHPSTSSYYRFQGSATSSPTSSAPVTPFAFMSSSQWPSASSSSHPASSYPQAYPSRMHGGYSLHAPLDTHAHSAAAAAATAHHVLPPLQDDYDDVEEDGLTELPSGVSLGGYAGGGLDGGAGAGAKEKQVRRRSSKACDQCRKSKCKCERSSQNEQCKNCVLLGTRASSVVSPASPVAHPAAPSVHVPRPLAQTWAAQGLHRCDRGPAASDRSPRRHPHC